MTVSVTMSMCVGMGVVVMVVLVRTPRLQVLVLLKNSLERRARSAPCYHRQLRLLHHPRTMRKRHASIVCGVVVPVRIVRDPKARELRAAPSEGDDLDDEDEENAEQRYGECVRLEMEPEHKERGM